MKRYAGAIRIEPCHDAALAARCGGVMLLMVAPVLFLPLPWWGAGALTLVWLAVCAREYRIHLSGGHPLSVRRFTLEPGGDCLLDFARGPREQRAVITARLVTSSWVLLRLRAPRRNAVLLLCRAQVPEQTWRRLQTRLRWQPGAGPAAGSPGG